MARLFSLLSLIVVVAISSAPANADILPSVKITAIQIAGATAKDEFVEITNTGATTVPIEGWRLSRATAGGSLSNLLTTFPNHELRPNTSIRIAHSEYAGSPAATFYYSTSQSIAADNSVILYSDAGATTVDLVGFGEATLKEGPAAPNPDVGVMVTRKKLAGLFLDTDNNAADFEITGAAPTPPPSPPPPSPSSNPPSPTPPPTAPALPPSPSHAFLPDDVVINEFLVAPNDDESEWIELYNRSSFDIDLTGWTLEDGAEKTTPLSGILGTSESKRFIAIEDLKSALNNAGDVVLLRDPSTQIIDRVVYGTWKNDATATAPKPPAGASTARKRDGLDSGNQASDFVVTHTPTKGAPNEIEDVASANTHALTITELYPNPPGDDGTDEFIEIKNTSDVSVALNGWTIADATSVRVPIAQAAAAAAIGPRAFIVLARPKTRIALNNTGGESVQLYARNALEPTAVARYTDSAPEGWSYSLNDGVYAWTKEPTPGKENVITVPNRPPIATIDADDTILANTPLTLDASDSQDPDGDQLTYAWTLPDGTAVGQRITALFDRPGTHTIVLEVRDPDGLTNTARHRVTVTAPDAVEQAPSPILTLKPSPLAPIINEVLANPEGDDEGEFIELKNPNDSPLELYGFLIDDAPMGSRPWKVPEETSIPPHGFLVLWHEDTGITLNNTGDSVRVLNADGTTATEVAIPTSPDGVAFDLASGTARPATPTPGSTNIVLTPSPAKEKKIDAEPPAALPIPPEEARAQKSGTRTTIEGVVIAPSDRFGTYFYLDGLKVSYGTIPVTRLAIGDMVRVTGTTAVRNGETQLTLKAPEDLVLLGNDGPPEAAVLADKELDDALVGRLVQISGTLTRRVGKNLYLANDGGDVRAYLAVPITIDIPPPSEGASLVVTGVVSKTSAGFRILPRSDADINVERVLGAATVAPEEPLETPLPLTIHPEARARMITKILLAISAGIALVLAILYYGRKNRGLHQEKNMIQ